MKQNIGPPNTYTHPDINRNTVQNDEIKEHIDPPSTVTRPEKIQLQ